MIYNTTHPNEDYNKETNTYLGQSFPFLTKLKMGGVGSGRMMLAEVSPNLQLTEKRFSEIDYGNIELRPKGILVHYTNGLDRFAWAIPYYRLVIYNSTYFSIHAEGNFLKFIKNIKYIENKMFINKMTNYKNRYLKLGYYDY
jgi:hypothetical protein